MPVRPRSYCFVFLAMFSSVAFAQDGKSIYQAHCATCHDSAQGRIPPVSALRAMSRVAILDALENGVM
jgi:mono/diheme cytochrome c family protein